MLAFIARNDDMVLWSHGNYQYEIEGNGISIRFEADLNDALLRLMAY